MRRVGIDVGGTNTDAVLVDDTAVVRSYKTPTTPDVTRGIATALTAVLGREDPASVDAVMVGTTHFTNAVVERRGLTPVAAVRIGLPASASLPPFVDWPRGLADLARGSVHAIAGGHEFDGRPIVPFDRAAMVRAAREIHGAGVHSVAVCSVFSPLTAQCEEEALEILAAEAPDARVTLSHTLGRIGLLERENAALLNAALIPLAERTVSAFRQAVAEARLTCPLLITLNDGTVATADTVARHPVLSFASGPTNSMRGAAFLSGMADALVADVGGTTTDVGCLVRGFPREANSAVEVGGVRTLFRMPDLLSVGLGGGSVVSEGGLRVGPQSVGYRIRERARVFGGPVLTATDVGVASGWIELPETGTRSVPMAPQAEVERAAATIHQLLFEAVDRMKTDARPEPLIAVGGGAFLVPDQLPGIGEVVRVPFHEVANAVGAAIAQVSGEIDRVYQDRSRREAIDDAVREAGTRAVASGADPATLVTVEVEDLPLAYLPGHALRVRAKVVGDVSA